MPKNNIPFVNRLFLLLIFLGGISGITARSVEQGNEAGNLAHPLAWDAIEKRYRAEKGETKHEFSFVVTNQGPKEIEITAVHASCSCTLAPKPENPWLLAPGANSTLKVTIDFSNKTGGVMKMIEVLSPAGSQILSIIVTIPEESRRMMNQKIAAADRQAVFHNDCATCHAAPVTEKTKTGAALFAGACSICHEAPHRATMVPDLAAINKPRDEAYWRKWVTDGGENTLMPAFAQKQGGPLDAAQIDALVDFLRTKYPDPIKKE